MPQPHVGILEHGVCSRGTSSVADYTVGEDGVCIEVVMHMAEVPVVHGVHFEAAYSTWWRVLYVHTTAQPSLLPVLGYE